MVPNWLKTFLCASALCALVLSPFDASALPNFFTQEGYIVDRNGAPVEGRFNIRVRLYSTAQGGDILFEEVHRAVDIERGLYAIAIGSGSTYLRAFSPRKCLRGYHHRRRRELTPLTPLYKIPAAMVADIADNVRGNIPTTALLFRV